MPDAEAAHGGVPFLQDALLFLAIAALLIPLLKRWRVSQVLAFLAVGAALGPFALGSMVAVHPWLRYVTITDLAGVRPLAELGVIFLLFMLGLELQAGRLLAMARWVFGAGTLQIGLSAAAIGLLAYWFGNSWQTAAVLGLSLSLSSTAIVVQLLAERRAIGTPIGRASLAVLLMQDLAVVPLLILVDTLGGSAEAHFMQAVGVALLKALVAITLIYLIGKRLVQPLFHQVAAEREPDTFTALTLLVTLGTAVLTWAAGLSMALGAFLAGLMLAETAYRHEVRLTIEPFKGLLLGLFFMSVGMGIDLRELLAEPLWIPLSVCGLILLKAAVVSVVFRGYGLSWGEAIESGSLLGQGGEFAFIVVGIASRQGLLAPPIGQFMLLVVGLSMLATPLAARLGQALGAWFARRGAAEGGAPLAPPMPELAGHVLILGFGRVGQLLAEILDREELPFLAIDLDADQVARLYRQGLPVFYGDASRAELLRLAGAERAQAVVITLDAPEAALRAANTLTTYFPQVPIIARARDDSHASALWHGGVSMVVPETLESGLQLAGHTLEQLGFSAEAALMILQQVREDRLADLKPP